MASLLTCEGVASYPHVFKATLSKNPKPTDKPAWSLAILFTKAGQDSKEIRALLAEAIRVARERFGPEVSDKIQWVENGKQAGASFLACGDDAIGLPFRRDMKKRGYPDDIAVYFNARKTNDPEKDIRAPEVIGRNAKPITDTREIYPGVRLRISVNPFAYDTDGNKGVSFGLNNVQKLGDGPRIDDRKDAKDEFGALEDEPAADMAGELASLTG